MTAERGDGRPTGAMPGADGDASPGRRTQSASRPKLGLDVYSLRSNGWDPVTALDYCAGLGAEVVLFSEPRFLGSLDPSHLAAIRARASELGVGLEVGMGSICPSSGIFRPEDGTATEQLTRMLDVARQLGSPFVRCYVGSEADRGPGMPTHIASAVATCRGVERTALELGIGIAVENHAGDLQSVEVRDLIEQAGPHFVGALFDAGNAAWTLEEPLGALEVLAPFVLGSGIRDSRVWETADGAAVEWVPLGDGDAEIALLCERFAEACPGKSFTLEIIPYPPREFPHRRRDFWERYRDVPAWTFARFREWVQSASARHGPGGTPVPPGTDVPTTAERERADVETAMVFARTVLGLGAPMIAGSSREDPNQTNSQSRI